jgi:hypothetical protein
MPGLPSWPATGYTFHTWILVDNAFRVSAAAAIPDGVRVVDRSFGAANGGVGTAHILSVADDEGRSVDLYLRDFKLYYSCQHRKADAQTFCTGFTLQKGVWHSVGVSHVGKSGVASVFGRVGEVKVMVDGKPARGQMRYPHFRNARVELLVSWYPRLSLCVAYQCSAPHSRG